MSLQPLLCTCCGKRSESGLFVSDRFQSLRLCHACIRRAQLELFKIHGDVPNFPWLVLDHTWLVDTYTARLIPPEAKRNDTT